MDGDLAPAERFGMTLRDIREEREMSRAEVARLAELDYTEIELLENGECGPRLEVMIRLSAVLEVPPGAFFDRIDWMPIGPPPARQGGRFRLTSC